jgi:hypothetical protein
MTVHEILAAHPTPTRLDPARFRRFVDECLDCAASCTACADACLAEPDVAELTRAIRLNLDCADACETARRAVTRQTAPDLGVLRALVEACSVACASCRDECERHAAHHEHCRLCAEVCQRCKEACDDLLAAL